jgi:hypothetical protein
VLNQHDVPISTGNYYAHRARRVSGGDSDSADGANTHHRDGRAGSGGSRRGPNAATFSLEWVAYAYKLLEQPETWGKIVLIP